MSAISGTERDSGTGSRGGGGTLLFGPFALDVAVGELRRDGARVPIQEKPLRLLATLLLHSGAVVTRADLHKELWPDAQFLDFEDGLNTAVRKLREALGDPAGEPRFIRTIPRRGYSWIGPTPRSSAPPAAATQAPMQALVPTAEASLAPTAAPPTSPPPLPSAAPSPSSLSLAQPPPNAAKPWRRALAWTAALLLLALAGGAAWEFRARPALPLSAGESILVVNFDNQTGEPRLDRALDAAFRVSLEQSRQVSVYPAALEPAALRRMGRPEAAPITAAVGREICRREGLRAMVAPGITRVGGEYLVTAELTDPDTGGVVRSYTRRAPNQAAVLDALDSIAGELRRDLGESLDQLHQASAPLPRVTTPSLAALQDYAEGQQQWRAGQFDRAVTLYHAALAADADFAMARAALANADCSYVYNHSAACRAEYQRALARPDRLTARERLAISATRSDDLGDVADAGTLYQQYLALYPNDWSLLNAYARLLRTHGRAAQAVPIYQRLARVAPGDARNQIELATADNALGLEKPALAAYHLAFRLNPEEIYSGNTDREYGFAYVALGDLPDARAAFAPLLARPEARERGLISLAWLDLWQGRYGRAGRRIQQAEPLARALSPLSRARLRFMLALIAAGRGDQKGEVAQLDAALAHFDQIQPKVLWAAMVGQQYARAGAAAKAKAVLIRIAPLAAATPNDAAALTLLRAAIATASGQPARGAAMLGAPDPAAGNSVRDLTLEALARSERLAGDRARARAWYEQVLAPPYRYLSWEPQQRALAARYWLAEEYWEGGDPARARATLAPLLTLWADADPDLTLRQRAESLAKKLAPPGQRFAPVRFAPATSR